MAIHLNLLVLRLSVASILINRVDFHKRCYFVFCDLWSCLPLSKVVMYGVVLHSEEYE